MHKFLVRLAVEPGDSEKLSELFLALLQHLAQWGHDVAPTRENADRFVHSAFTPAAHKGEPVLLAWPSRPGHHFEGKPVGAIFWVRAPGDPTKAIGYGTYVAPEFQRQGLGLLLREEAVKRLRALKVATVFGAALQGNDAGHASLLAMGMKPKSTVYTLTL